MQAIIAIIFIQFIGNIIEREFGIAYPV